MIDLRAIAQALPDAEAYCRLLGLVPHRGPRRDTVRVLCPWHSEKTPSCDVTRQADRIAVKCRACDAGGDHLHLFAVAQGLDLRTDFRRAALELARLLGVIGVDTPSAKQPPRRPHDPVIELARLIDRLPDYWELHELEARLRLPEPAADDEQATKARARDIRRKTELDRLTAPIRHAHPETIVEAMRVYVTALARRTAVDAELDRLADLFEAEEPARIARALANLQQPKAA